MRVSTRQFLAISNGISGTNEGRTRDTPSAVDARLAITAASREIRSALGSYRRSTSLLSRGNHQRSGIDLLRPPPSSIQCPLPRVSHHSRFIPPPPSLLLLARTENSLGNSSTIWNFGKSGGFESNRIEEIEDSSLENSSFSLSLFPFSSRPDDPPNYGRRFVSLASHALQFAFHRGVSTFFSTGILFVYKKRATVWSILLLRGLDEEDPFRDMLSSLVNRM